MTRSFRVTLVVAFGFLTQNFERWQRPRNVYFCHSMNAGSVVETLKSYLM